MSLPVETATQRNLDGLAPADRARAVTSSIAC